LTKSTSSDSIWAMSCWLMCINVFFFDYGGAVGSKFVNLPLPRSGALGGPFLLTRDRLAQTPRVALDKRCADGVHCARVAPAFHDACVLPHSLLH
jgi:hypothetical protein